MFDDKFEEIIESHRVFVDGAFGQWLQNELGEKVGYFQNKMLSAKSWDEFTEARSNYAATQRLYNMVVNPQQFFN